MSKLLQVRVDDKLKTAADSVFSSMGFDTSTAIRMFLTAAVETRSIPFEVKSRVGAIELNDGHGSYICEYGHVHDYSQKPVEYEISGSYSSYDEYLKAMNEDLSDNVSN